jgi:hypothetical protein
VTALAGAASNGAAKSSARQRSFEREAVAALAKPQVNTLPASGKTLGGLTSQQQAIVLAIAKKDKQVTQVVTALNLTCASGLQLLVPDDWTHLKIAHNGAVSAIALIAPGNGITGGTDTFSGKLNAKKATFSGTWELKLGFSDPTTGQTDQCDSGLVTFHTVL